jgi:hypothetical protein
MAERFDPYYTWLGIPPEEHPPDHYRLLGIRRFEENEDVIANAADQRMAYIRTFQTGRRSKESQAILNEVATARTCLLDADKKRTYDAKLKQPADVAAPASPGLTPLGPAKEPELRLQPLVPIPMAQPLSELPATPALVPQVFGAPALDAHRPPQLVTATAAKPAWPSVTLPLALAVGGGSFAIGLIVLIATLIWAAS